jgi:hypothetical protein
MEGLHLVLVISSGGNGSNDAPSKSSVVVVSEITFRSYSIKCISNCAKWWEWRNDPLMMERNNSFLLVVVVEHIQNL